MHYFLKVGKTYKFDILGVSTLITGKVLEINEGWILIERERWEYLINTNQVAMIHRLPED
jgi:hypothetical protein